MNVPICANFTAGACPVSSTHVERETDQAFTIRCRTCNGVNVWPKEKSENAGRYEAFLRSKIDMTNKLELWDQRPRYSK